VYIKCKNFAVVEIPKCASRSLYATITSEFEVDNIAAHATLQQYKDTHSGILGGAALVREPTERFRSAVQYLAGVPDSILGDNKNLENEGSSRLRGILSELKFSKGPSFQNIVLYPQYSFLLSDVPVKIYPMQNLHLLLSHLGINRTAYRINTSASSPLAEFHIDSVGRKYVENFYSIDFALYRDVMLSSDGFLELQNPREYFYSIR